MERRMLDAEIETAAEANRYDRWAAQTYLNAGDLDDVGTAYWHFTIARCGRAWAASVLAI
jgi:hypothetical protein